MASSTNGEAVYTAYLDKSKRTSASILGWDPQSLREDLRKFGWTGGDVEDAITYWSSLPRGKRQEDGNKRKRYLNDEPVDNLMCEICKILETSWTDLISHSLTHATNTSPTLDIKQDFHQVQHGQQAGLATRPPTVYLRKEAHHMLKELGSGNAIIEGAPGTGKSTITWLWACHQSFSICWVGAGTFGIKTVTILNKGQIVYSAQYNDIQYLPFSLLDVDCLVLDGATRAFEDPLYKAYRWLCNKPGKRRLIITSSAQANIKAEIREQLTLKTIFVDGWTKDEYKAALKDLRFQQEHSDIVADDDFEEKYEWAGASARWMFGSWKALREAVDLNIASASSSTDIMQGFLGDRSKTVVNHLITRIEGNPQFVSKRVTVEIIAKHDRAFLVQLRSHQFCSNPSFAGWVFKGEVLMRMNDAAAKHEPVIVNGYEKPAEQIQWCAAKMHSFFNATELSQIANLEVNDYLVPIKWNQGCYDLLRILADGVVQFVQITMAKTHSFKIKYVTEVLDALAAGNHFKVRKINVVFLIPTGGTFTIPRADLLPTKYRDLLTNTDFNINTIDRVK